MKKFISLLLCVFLIVLGAISFTGCDIAYCKEDEHNYLVSSINYRKDQTEENCGGEVVYKCSVCGKEKNVTYTGHIIDDSHKTEDEDGVFYNRDGSTTTSLPYRTDGYNTGSSVTTTPMRASNKVDYYTCLGCGVKCNAHIYYYSSDVLDYSIITGADHPYLRNYIHKYYTTDKGNAYYCGDGLYRDKGIVVASIYNGKPVTKMYENVFSELHVFYYGSITLPSLLKEIGTKCFNYDKSLSNIYVPATIEVMASGTFANSTGNLQYAGTVAQFKKLVKDNSGCLNNIYQYTQSTKYVYCSDGIIAIGIDGYNGVINN